MDVLIVEDEPLAAAQLAALIAALRPESKILAVCDTVESTVAWLNENQAPDLAFFDIQLGDGLSFQIFDQISVDLPVIFTTAFDQYAIKAFKVNGIDYVLKPIDKNELEAAILKFEKRSLAEHDKPRPELVKTLVDALKQKTFKERFLVKVGTHLRIVETAKVGYFYSFQKGTYLKTIEGKDYLMDHTLEQIEQLINPEMFYRINRKYLVSLCAITEVSVHSNSRLKLKVDHADEDDFLVAREKVKSFKIWFEGEM